VSFTAASFDKLYIASLEALGTHFIFYLLLNNGLKIKITTTTTTEEVPLSGGDAKVGGSAHNFMYRILAL